MTFARELGGEQPAVAVGSQPRTASLAIRPSSIAGCVRGTSPQEPKFRIHSPPARSLRTIGSVRGFQLQVRIASSPSAFSLVPDSRTSPTIGLDLLGWGVLKRLDWRKRKKADTPRGISASFRKPRFRIHSLLRGVRCELDL